MALRLLSFVLCGSLWARVLEAFPLLVLGRTTIRKSRQHKYFRVSFQKLTAMAQNLSISGKGRVYVNVIGQEEEVDAIRTMSKQWNITLTASETKKLVYRMSPVALEKLQQNCSLHQFSEKVGHISKAKRKQLLLRHPILLSQVLSSNLPSVQQYICENLQLNTSTQRNKVQRSIVKQRSRSCLQQWFHVMSQHFNRDDIRFMVLKAPQLLNYGADNLQATLQYLYHDVGLTPTEVTSMLRTCPLLVSYSVDTRLRPMIHFIQKELSATEWKRIVVKYPQVLQIAIPKLQDQLTQLHDMLLPPELPEPSHEPLQRDQQGHHYHLPPPQQQAAPFGVRHMCALYPPLLWLSPALLRSKLLFFQTQLSMNTTELQIMITCFPQLLGLSVDNNLRPKLTFLLQHMTTGTLKEWILYQPSLVAYSLDNRIRPRVAMLQEHDIALCYSPPYLMSLPDKKFLAWVDMHRTTWTTTAT